MNSLPNEYSIDPIDDVDDDEEPVDVRDVTSAVVTDTDWTTETILSQMRRGNIQLNPRFQRRDAWDQSRKSRFIESLILGLPIPQLVLAADKRRRGSFIVLDGKQRLLTLAQFAKESSFDSAQANQEMPQLQLASLEVRPELRTLSLSALEQDARYTEDLDGFLNQTIRTVVVRNWPDEAFLNLIFLRLNTGSVSLSPQELRQALHPGPFTDFLDDHASASAPLRRALKIDRPDFRMRDVEILLRYFALGLLLNEYRGNLKKFLDDASDALNERWNEESETLKSLSSEFDEAVEATLSIFGSNAFNRWNPSRKKYESRFNRAVSDIMVYFFSNAAIRGAALKNKDAIEKKFRELNEENTSFVASIQTTTKTIEAVYTRLSVWGNGVREVTGQDFPVPYLDENNILHAR
jgi:hypothetical protein